MAAGSNIRIGIDIGGTFTDLVFMDAAGRLLRAKVLSTPDDYSEGIANGLESVASGARIADIAQIMHGTTVATNALLEGKGAKVALITTRSEERRVGKECNVECRSRWSPYH